MLSTKFVLNCLLSAEDEKMKKDTLSPGKLSLTLHNQKESVYINHKLMSVYIKKWFQSNMSSITLSICIIVRKKTNNNNSSSN